MTEIATRGVSARGGCPRCGTTIPFIKGNFRRERPFACTRCGAPLTTARGPASGAIALFSLAMLASEIISPVIVMLILILGVVIEWLTARVYLVEPRGQLP